MKKLSLAEQITREAERIWRRNGGSCPCSDCNSDMKEMHDHARDCYALRNEAFDYLDAHNAHRK